MTNTQVAERKHDWRAALDSRSEVFANSLPDDIPVERFLAVCKEAAARVDGLEEVLRVNPASAFGAFLACARDGLIPDGRQAHIDVRYSQKNGKQAAYMPMMRGIMERLHRSGLISDINIQVVYEGDEFVPDLSEGGRIIHIPKFATKTITHAYCIVNTKDGGTYREIMGAADIEKRRKSASTQFVWKQWPGEMARKTVLHNAAKKLPLTADDRRLVEHVETFADLNRDALLSEPAPVLLDISEDSEPAETEVLSTPALTDEEALFGAGGEAAMKGRDALDSFYGELNPDQQELVGERFDSEWAVTAQQADMNMQAQSA